MNGSRLAAFVVIFLVVMTGSSFWLMTREMRHRQPAYERDAKTTVSLSNLVESNKTSCLSCHEEIVATHQRSPHAKTLRRSDSKAISSFLNAKQESSLCGLLQIENDRLVITDQDGFRPVPVSWIFGSGEHAQTPVSTWLDPEGRTVMLEHALSWYPPGLISSTLGLSDDLQPLDNHLCGKLLTPEATRGCFGCHVTELPQRDGLVYEEEILTGVGCVRCHEGSLLHAQAMNAGDRSSPELSWRTLSPLDSIRRCGECHRRDDQFQPVELHPENKLLVRFAPVGLSQSVCFTSQEAIRFDCMSCHDPHSQASPEPAFYRDQCLSCHTAPTDKSPCPQATRTSACTECHMPKVEVNPHLRFTDHWIRKPSPLSNGSKSTTPTAAIHQE